MCCCGQPTVNGQPGYRWNDPKAEPGVYPVNPPTLEERDVLLYDEPGRCGGQDSHSFHYRVVLAVGCDLLVKHGGGEQRIRLSNPRGIRDALALLDSNGRYWVLNAIFHAQNNAAQQARDAERLIWRRAAAEKRIRTRKRRDSDNVRVWIDDPQPTRDTQATPAAREAEE